MTLNKINVQLTNLDEFSDDLEDVGGGSILHRHSKILRTEF